MINRVSLQREYVERIIEGMDMSDLCMIVSDYLHDNLEHYTDQELVEEIRDIFPFMINEEDDE